MKDYITFRRIKLQAPPPSDPRSGLLALAASTKSLRMANDRLEVRVAQLAQHSTEKVSTNATS